VADFDPYHEWLGVPPAEQPPTHYRLLGLAPFESNANVILSAYDRQISHVKKSQSKERQAPAQRLLDELTVAKLVLLNPGRRVGYDAVLRSAAPAAALETSESEAKPLASERPNPAAASRPIPVVRDERRFTPGGSLTKYKILESVPGSAHVRTHKAPHLQTDRYYLLKFVASDSLGNAEIVKRFERECDILTQLKHPNLIVGHESFAHDGQRFLVMEYVLGMDLGTLVKQQGPLAIDEAVDYLLQAARGLGQLHAAGVFHRNLKPQVLLVDLQGRIRITNLLLAKIGDHSPLASEDLTTTGEAMGTVDYLPPEQAVDARQADERSDIYALGCTLFHLLLGRPPFTGKGPMQKIMAHRQTPPPSLVASRTETPAWLDGVFQRMMAKDPRLRYHSTDELIAALESPAAQSSWKRWLPQWKIGRQRPISD
jgi:serine/threonine protein kinase